MTVVDPNMVRQGAIQISRDNFSNLCGGYLRSSILIRRTSSILLGMVADMIELMRQYGRYGYRWVAALLIVAGRPVNDKRVERLWRCEGLKAPMKQPKKGRLKVGYLTHFSHDQKS